MIRQQLQTVLSQLQQLEAAYSTELATLPEGRLHLSRSKDCDRLYVVDHVDGRYCRRGIKRNKELLRKHCRKSYLEQAVHRLRGNIALVQAAAEGYKPVGAQAILNELEAFQGIVPEVYFLQAQADAAAQNLDASDEQRIASHSAWGNQPYEAASFREEERTVITSRGEHMRSKAEALIAEKLYEYGIPFRYEQRLELGGRLFAPDFTFEGAHGELFYLEFCGMMDDPDYVRGFQRKRQFYENAGIVPWKNIIYLYASGNEINMMHIDNVIRTQIIPWL